MFPSSKKQAVDLFCKSADWLLYDGNIGRWKVNTVSFNKVNLIWFLVDYQKELPDTGILQSGQPSLALIVWNHYSPSLI